MKARYPICLLESTRRYCSRRSRHDLRIVSNHLKYKNCILIYLYRYCVVCLLVYCMLTAWGITFYIYILFLFLTLTSIFLYLGLPSLYHLAFYGAKLWRFCQIPNTRRCLIRLKLFRNAFHKCCTFGYSKKLSTELLGVLTPRNHHLLMHVKRLYDDEMTE